MPDALDLVPCPFCGNSAIVRSSVIPGRGFCEECGAEGPWSPYFEGDWNTRAPDPRVAALIEALEGIRLSWATGVVKSDAQHTLILEDGSRHTGPAVDFLARLAGAQVDLIDAALAAFKGGANG